MKTEEFNTLLQGYIGAQQLQYGNVEDRLRFLDAILTKNLSSMNYNQVSAVHKAQKSAYAHLRKMQSVEKAAETRRAKAQEARNGR